MPQKAEERMREGEQRLRMALKAASMVTWEWDIPAGTIRYSANVTELAGGEAIEPFCTVSSLIQEVHADDRSALTQAIERTVGEGAPYECEYRVRMLNGTDRWILGRGDVVERREGKPVRAVGISQDITARKEAEEALQQRSRQLADLATQITLVEHRERRRLADYLHDHLQQLLVGARMQVHALAFEQELHGRNALDKISKALTEAIEAARSMSLDIAPPIAVHRHLPDAFQWLVRNVRQRHKLEVQAHINGQLTEVPEADSILLFATARELLLNVVKHAGVLKAELELARVTNAVVLTIRDRGHGFDPARLASQEPHGFGLFSIRERVDSLGGNLTLQSRPNHGVIVAVSVPLPVAPPAARPQPRTRKKRTIAIPDANSTSPPARPRRISTLFADDHRIVRESLVNLLRAEPDIAVVGQCDDGRQVIEAAGRLQPDVVIMDVSMPVMDGVEATRFIKERWPQIRVIGLSMYEEAQGAGKMRAAGADGYVSKSEPPAELINAIRQCVRQRQAPGSVAPSSVTTSRRGHASFRKASCKPVRPAERTR
ncbi:MAG: response regulator [Lentisphaerae bacterium]|nr:response regulator [Lentisphaerota bacterium]